MTGTTVLGPTCPVQRVGQPCVTTISAAVRITTADGRKVAEVTSTADGSFVVALPPGTYTVSGVRGITGPGMFTKSQSVTLTPHMFVTVTVTFDTGIR